MSSAGAGEEQVFGPPTIQLLVNASWALMVSRRFNYAVFAIMIWDLILTFPKEVRRNAAYWDSLWLI